MSNDEGWTIEIEILEKLDKILSCLEEKECEQGKVHTIECDKWRAGCICSKTKPYDTPMTGTHDSMCECEECKPEECKTCKGTGWTWEGDGYLCKDCTPTPEAIDKFKKCSECWAHYTGEHTCPPWMKALVKASDTPTPKPTKEEPTRLDEMRKLWSGKVNYLETIMFGKGKGDIHYLLELLDKKNEALEKVVVSLEIQNSTLEESTFKICSEALKD